MFKEKEKKTALIGIILDGVLFQGFVRRGLLKAVVAGGVGLGSHIAE